MKTEKNKKSFRQKRPYLIKNDWKIKKVSLEAILFAFSYKNADITDMTICNSFFLDTKRLGRPWRLSSPTPLQRHTYTQKQIDILTFPPIRVLDNKSSRQGKEGRDIRNSKQKPISQYWRNTKAITKEYRWSGSRIKGEVLHSYSWKTVHSIFKQTYIYFFWKFLNIFYYPFFF